MTSKADEVLYKLGSTDDRYGSYPGLWKRHALDEYVAPQPETDNYNVFEADDNQLVLSGYLPDGTLLHQTIVRKD